MFQYNNGWRWLSRKLTNIWEHRKPIGLHGGIFRKSDQCAEKLRHEIWFKIYDILAHLPWKKHQKNILKINTKYTTLTKNQDDMYVIDRKIFHKCILTPFEQQLFLGPILFLLFINDISNFAVEGCVLNMYADDVIIYTSATSKDELESRLQVCIDNISNWYSMNKLCINKKKSNVMVIGSKWQLKSLNLDDFTISVDSDKLFLARQAKYLGLWVRSDLSWDDHILELCRKMHYHFHMFRRLRKILPSALLLNIYKTYVQSKIDYGLSIWGCTTEVNLDRVQRIQNLLARIICNNFDYIHSRGIDLVRSYKLQTIRERRDYFLCVLMFKCIHGLAPHYLSNDVTMHVDIHWYDTRSAENMDLYIPRCAKEIYKRSFLYKGSSFWKKLPPWVKESTSLNDFKHNYRFLNGWMHFEFIVPFICTSILYHILMLSFYQFCLQLDRYNHIRNLSQAYHDIDAFMYDLYLWMCIYVFFLFMYFTL